MDGREDSGQACVHLCLDKFAGCVARSELQALVEETCEADAVQASGDSQACQLRMCMVVVMCGVLWATLQPQFCRAGCGCGVAWGCVGQDLTVSKHVWTSWTTQYEAL